jgi:hypothetical protein|tara:strand:- start:73 stop:267 length:195 start_codon:yes stop_codon:yes gene_type:complete
MVTEPIVGQMVKNIVVNGLKTKCTERASVFGMIADVLKVAILMIKNMGMVFFRGQMERSMMASG